MAIVSGVNADGSVDGAEWSDYQGNGWGMEVAVQPRLPTYTNGPAGGVWYPYAQLGDRLILVPLGYEYPVSPPTGERRCIMWHDMTPRIQLDANTKSGGDPPPHERDVYVDFSGGSGQPWHLDQDT